jgi:hypothetical protein
MIKTNSKIDSLKDIINTQNLHITNLNNTISELKNQNRLNILSTENKMLKHHTTQVTNVVKNINNGSITQCNIQNITQYIINTFPDAPNVKQIDHIEDIDKYINSDLDTSYSQLIHDYYFKDIDPKDRSLWLVDSSRDKYLTRLNNHWHVDMNGTKFCKTVNSSISQAIDKKRKGLEYDQKSLVLLELMIHICSQDKISKHKKSSYLIQNIKDWKDLQNKN